MTIFSYKNIYVISFPYKFKKHISGLNKIYCTEGSSHPPKPNLKNHSNTALYKLVCNKGGFSNLWGNGGYSKCVRTIS